MFLKQTTYKPRSNSQSSTGSQGATGQTAGTSPPKEEAKPATGGPVTPAAAGRRRSSAAGADKFAGLHGYKRTGQDASSGDRKASWAEQKPGAGGMLSNAWNSFTKGT